MVNFTPPSGILTIIIILAIAFRGDPDLVQAIVFKLMGPS